MKIRFGRRAHSDDAPREADATRIKRLEQAVFELAREQGGRPFLNAERLEADQMDGGWGSPALAAVVRAVFDDPWLWKQKGAK